MIFYLDLSKNRPKSRDHIWVEFDQHIFKPNSVEPELGLVKIWLGWEQKG